LEINRISDFISIFLFSISFSLYFISSKKEEKEKKENLKERKWKNAICFMGGNIPMKSIISEIWHGNIIPQEDSRINSPEMKELLGFMARHHEDLEKSFSDEQKVTFEKFHDCWSE